MHTVIFRNSGAKPMKTLEQREAEYAEARMRIFGSTASSPDKEEATSGNGDCDLTSTTDR